jgi:hypothetical protein
MPMVRHLLPLALLGACTQAPETTLPGATPGGGEPISTQQVLQGIQIGEGGDLLPCDPVLTEVHDADASFADLQGSWDAASYDLDSASGTVDLGLALAGTWELDWVDQGSTGFDCAGEPTVLVGGLWLDLRGDLSATFPVFARTPDLPASSFVGRAEGTWLGLEEGAYDLVGTVTEGALGIDVFDDLLYGNVVGRFAAD